LQRPQLEISETGHLNAVEYSAQAITTWNNTSDQINEVIASFRAKDMLNPVYMMAFSGAREKALFVLLTQNTPNQKHNHGNQSFEPLIRLEIRFDIPLSQKHELTVIRKRYSTTKHTIHCVLN
jgi:hypothetical protein